MSESQITRSALSWLRETDTLRMQTLKKAYWERLEVDTTGYATVSVANESYHPDERAAHSYDVGVTQHGIVHHCTCPHFQYRDEVCKHMVATAMAIDDGSLDLDALGCFEDVIARAQPQA